MARGRTGSSITRSSPRTAEPIGPTRSPPRCANPSRFKDRTQPFPPGAPSIRRRVGATSVRCNFWARPGRIPSSRSSTTCPRWPPAFLGTARCASSTRAATGSPTGWDTYQLVIGGLFAAPQTYVGGARFILNGPSGPLDVPLGKRAEAQVGLRYAGDTFGTAATSRIEVAPMFGPAPALANHTSVSLYLAQGNASVGTIAWVVGYGEPIGRLPPLTFTTQGTNPWQATANAWFWGPELALNRTIRASLLENGIAVLTNVSVVGGILGTFANGTLAFTDSDGDGSLSTGDVFTVTGASGNRYELDVSVLYETAWRAYM